ncbi:type II toxin-antitoxin system RelE/ParE family toxin [Scytonema hofmannii]|uniref:type II toxin-antitoxin system RelE/ParE family toxin n=1 Tax=Scytonema hofmannii TaxID=34078 RepID=UPI0004767CAA|nr:type II toxin-antitoxin system RelE/ParE family toxin [Scytonema hofmannii]
MAPEGTVPFAEWLDSLRDKKAKAKIKERLKRVSLGNLGDCKSVGGGVFELRIDYGPGYRVYYGQVGLIIVILLLGRDKSTQEQDIRKAQEYWADYEKNENAD